MYTQQNRKRPETLNFGSWNFIKTRTFMNPKPKHSGGRLEENVLNSRKQSKRDCRCPIKRHVFRLFTPERCSRAAPPSGARPTHERAETAVALDPSLSLTWFDVGVPVGAVQNCKLHQLHLLQAVFSLGLRTENTRAVRTEDARGHHSGTCSPALKRAVRAYRRLLQLGKGQQTYKQPGNRKVLIYRHAGYSQLPLPTFLLGNVLHELHRFY